jgi:hypothetical protein
VRSPRTWLRCREPDCGLVIHSDQAGSRIMISEQRPDTRWDGLEASPRTETLSWQQHTWDRVDSGNQPSTSALSEAAYPPTESLEFIPGRSQHGLNTSPSRQNPMMGVFPSRCLLTRQATHGYTGAWLDTST